jgi:outer membrane protein assembly factor BamB
MKAILILLLTSLLHNPVLTAENWPWFRGPTRQGISTETGLPTHWSATSNVVWRTTIPGEGSELLISPSG